MKKIIMFLLLPAYIFMGCKAAESEALCDRFVRVHVLANSNSAYDQSIKLSARDYLFKEYEKEFAQFKNKNETLSFINNNKQSMEEKINGFLKKNNCNYNCKIDVVREEFPNKKYYNINLPKGTYDAIKIKLGKALGKNFFCVMFPPLCVSKGVTTDIKLDDVLTDEDSEKIEYRFKIMELLGF